MPEHRPQDVVFAHFRLTWAAAEARGRPFAQDRLAAALVRSPRVDRVLIADGVRSVAAVAYHRLRRDEARFRGEPGARHCAPVRLAKDEPTTPAAARRVYRLYDLQLRRAARGMRRPAVISPNPLLVAYAPLSWAGSVTLYATDDWVAHHAHAAHHDVYEDAYEQIRRRGTAVCAVSPGILESMRPTGPAVVVPNGIEPGEWASPGPPPAWLAELPQPRLLYLGTLDRRLDTAVLTAIAHRFPGGSLVLVGPRHDRPHLEEVARRPNVHLMPPVPRAEVPAITAAADVCVVPHVRTKLTEAMSPLKLYEALAAGRAVAATDLPPMRGVDRRVVLAEPEPESFVTAVERALALGAAPGDERRRFAAANSWAARHDAILDVALRG